MSALSLCITVFAPIVGAAIIALVAAHRGDFDDD